MKWRIYFSDGSTFDSSQGNPIDASKHGVICIVYPHELIGRIIMHGWDFYYYVPDSPEPWWGSDIHGVLDRAAYHGTLYALKYGRNVTNGRYAEVMGMADKDLDFPPKSGKLKQERPH